MSEETIDQYVTEVCKLENTCEFGVNGETLIKDRLIRGVQVVKLKERFDLTLDKALSISRAAEVSKIQVKGLEGTLSSKVKEVDTLSTSESQSHNRSGSQSSQGRVFHQSDRRFIQECSKCGKSHVIRRCPGNVRNVVQLVILMLSAIPSRYKKW